MGYLSMEILMAVWRYKIDQDVEIETLHLKGTYFENKWIKIHDGKMTIRSQYAWDGCSPAYCIRLGTSLPNGLWIGIWDGPKAQDGLPVTWLASLFHDALCQFRKDIRGLTKKKTVLIFEELLIERKAPWYITYLYPKAIDLFGPQEWY